MGEVERHGPKGQVWHVIGRTPKKKKNKIGLGFDLEHSIRQL